MMWNRRVRWVLYVMGFWLFGMKDVRGEVVMGVKLGEGASDELLESLRETRESSVEEPSFFRYPSFYNRPVRGQRYRVRAGDTLSYIARLSGVSVEDLVRLNPEIDDPNLIHPGQILRLGEEAEEEIKVPVPTEPVREITYRWPTQGIITSRFGAPRGQRRHQGVDIANAVGTPIYAAAAGRVVFSGWNPDGYGNLVVIEHSNGDLTYYAHNVRNWVQRGQEVRQGQWIADMGNTGFSTGPHLHFEIRRGRRPIDPLALLAFSNLSRR